MFKLKALAILLLSAVCAATQANADAQHKFTRNVFLGVSIDDNFFSSPQTQTSDGVSVYPTDSSVTSSSYSIMLGKRWNRLGVQLGYSFFRDVPVYGFEISNATISRNNIFIDGLFFYPISCTIDLKGALGLGLMHSKATGNYSVFLGPSGSFNMSNNQLSPRIGAGLEWRFVDNMSVDLMARYQRANFLFKNDVIVSLGLYYHL